MGDLFAYERTRTRVAAAPTATAIVDLGEPLTPIAAAMASDGTPFRDAEVLVRLHGAPLGLVRVPLPAATDALAEAIWSGAGEKLVAHARAHACVPVAELGADALKRGLPARSPCDRPAPGDAPATVIVPTGGRPAQLAACLDSLRAMRHPRFEVLVVDNRPADPATREVVARVRAQDDRVGYLAEPRPGSSVARNAGLARARTEVVAFTDDDVIVDPGWLTWMVQPFAEDPRVDVVTGLVLPAALETRAQRWFEEYAGFAKGFDRRAWDLDVHRDDDLFLYPYWGGAFGSGNSMAFRRSALCAIGGFDPALGAGSPARGGADIESFSHLILRGGRLVYEPRAVCWHEHRRDEEAVRRQIHSYGVGFTAVLMKWALRDARVLAAAARGAGLLARRALSPGGLRRGRREALPAELNRLELRGYLAGPALYVRSARWARRLGLREEVSA